MGVSAVVRSVRPRPRGGEGASGSRVGRRGGVIRGKIGAGIGSSPGLRAGSTKLAT